jgi:uncharacterized protein YcbK (DUF882 family)
MINRRNFVKTFVACTTLYPFRNALAFRKSERILNLLNVHTREKLNIKYYACNTYDNNAIGQINYFLRCHYTNEVKEIDVEVIDLLCDIKDRIDKSKEIQIISGYRSQTYNNLLVSEGKHVSKKSLHIQGMAIDFTIHGITNRKLSHIAKSFAAGGVGRYPDFVHIDVGRIRYW